VLPRNDIGTMLASGGSAQPQEQTNTDTDTTHRIDTAEDSGTARHFETAQQWCNLLYEEFWRQETWNGLEVSSTMNGRVAANKTGS
jgi:hypothetical protein